MFLGSIPEEMRSMVAEITKPWPVKEIAVGCSGNFTIERVLSEQGFSGVVRSNDVTLYSCSLGQWLTGLGPALAVRPEYMDDYGWLEKYMATPDDTMATVLLATRLLEGLGKDNPYYRRMREGYTSQWAGLHAKTVAKIRKVACRVGSFYGGDVVDFIETVPESAGFVSFPPFYKGGYEKMFENL